MGFSLLRVAEFFADLKNEDTFNKEPPAMDGFGLFKERTVVEFLYKAIY